MNEVNGNDGGEDTRIIRRRHEAGQGTKTKRGVEIVRIERVPDGPARAREDSPGEQGEKGSPEHSLDRGEADFRVGQVH